MTNLDTEYKKAIIQIAKELKKSNQISAAVGTAMIKQKLDENEKVEETQGRKGVS